MGNAAAALAKPMKTAHHRSRNRSLGLTAKLIAMEATLNSELTISIKPGAPLFGRLHQRGHIRPLREGRSTFPVWTAVSDWREVQPSTACIAAPLSSSGRQQLHRAVSSQLEGGRSLGSRVSQHGGSANVDRKLDRGVQSRPSPTEPAESNASPGVLSLPSYTTFRGRTCPKFEGLITSLSRTLGAGFAR